MKVLFAKLAAVQPASSLRGGWEGPDVSRFRTKVLDGNAKCPLKSRQSFFKHLNPWLYLAPPKKEVLWNTTE
ncbi:hypothetical protein SY85_15400 [Flavisolibacter tropicus]|uniref:Uncharacterized protein n=1 Tax=Flavisolibacter tropicus TaxID=1492898 RepID=A0A172TXB7_9BACT|nr:hypothetical protein SY85_15400 [Flavisolibacter tropicus]